MLQIVSVAANDIHKSFYGAIGNPCNMHATLGRFQRGIHTTGCSHAQKGRGGLGKKREAAYLFDGTAAGQAALANHHEGVSELELVDQRAAVMVQPQLRFSLQPARGRRRHAASRQWRARSVIRWSCAHFLLRQLLIALVATSRYGYFRLWLLPVMATSRYGYFQLWLLPVMATSGYGYFPLWLLPVMATSRYGYFPLWLLPVMATSRCGYFLLWLLPLMATSPYGYFRLWLLPVMATSRSGYFPLWLLPIMATSRYGYFPLWLLPVMATSRYGYFPL